MTSEPPHMFAVKATFDGERIVLPKDLRGLSPGNVVVIVEDTPNAEDRALWLKAQDAAFIKAWDNPEDEVYDHL